MVMVMVVMVHGGHGHGGHGGHGDVYLGHGDVYLDRTSNLNLSRLTSKSCAISL